MKRILAILLSIMMILPLCVVFSASAATSTAIYIDDINTYGSGNIGPILLYGSNMSPSDFGVSAHDWWHKVVLTFDPSDNSFVVKQTCFYTPTVSDTTYTSVTLSASDVMIMTHSTFADFNNAIGALSVGDKLYAYGFDFTNATSSDMLSNSVSNVCFTTYEPSLGDDYFKYVTPVEPEVPENANSNLVSLGAKANAELFGLRMGATLTRDNSRGEVLDLGMLVISENYLNVDELNLEYAAANPSVADVKARTIENYVEGQDFEEYETVTYYATIVGLENHQSENIVARPYVTYRSGSEVVTYYGETFIRNYKDVLESGGDTITPSEPEDDTTTPSDPEYDNLTTGNLTYVNGFDWSELSYQNNIYAFASTDASATPAEIIGQEVGFLSWWNGIVLEYNETNDTWEVVDVDFKVDGVNTAETATLGENRLVVIFHDEAAIGQTDSYNFFKYHTAVGEEFTLTGDITVLQAIYGKLSNVSLSTPGAQSGDDDTSGGTSIGTIESTIGTYTSNSSPTASSGDTDGLSCVLYAPQSNTTGISTHLNLGAVDTTLYTSSDALIKQTVGSGIATDKDVDNAYLYLCLNSTNWSGDFGVIKRLNDEDWEIVTSEYYYSTWRWNAYAYPSTSGVTVYYNSDYVYSKWNTMDGINSYYINNSETITDLQMNLIYSGGTLTYSLLIDGVTIFSVSDTGTISNGKYGRAASVTNSGDAASSASANYLYQISSTLLGRTPAAVENIQFYDTYYYTSSGAKTLNINTGSLWLYPNRSSSAGYLTNTDGDPIVTCQEVMLTDGRIMDIINIKNY